VIAVAPAVANNEDVAGWHGAKWGMTPGQLERVVDNTEPADLSKVCGTKCGEGAALQRENYALNDQHFTVRFWFSKDELRLHAISMYAEGLKNDDGAAFASVKQFYTNLYGTPGSVMLKHGYFVMSWSLTPTIVTLYSNGANELSVVYEEDVEKR
jgi:hypothetical protein